MDFNNIGTHIIEAGFYNMTSEDAAKVDRHFKEYVERAYRTFVDLGSHALNRQHMMLGMQTEFGEIADAIKKNIAYNRPIDVVNIKEELGDVIWYIACWYRCCGREEIVNSQSTFAIVSNSAEKAFNCTDLRHQEVFGCTISDLLFYVQRTYTLHFEEPDSVLNFWLLVCKAFGLSADDMIRAMDLNINKLKVRYPEKFSDVLALDRDLDAEREVLEN